MKHFEAVHLQISWFAGGVEERGAGDIFRTIIGVDPETERKNHGTNPAVDFVTMSSGINDDAFYEVSVHPGRLNIHIRRTETPSPFGNEFTLADTEGHLTKMVDVLGNHAPQLPHPSRLSVVAVLQEKLASRDDGMRFLTENIGVSVPCEQPRDIAFQVNCRKKSSVVAELEFNRFVRFELGSAQEISLDADNGRQALINEFPISTLLLDFNSVPNGQLLDGGKAYEHLKELRDELLRVRSNPKVASLGD